ncbi:unannotated protein [freshwater metagenome]|uniref:Unannotated protein n=1 Tax=freshwater metagenome TaxID=449393 RepID=A0A6J6PEL7_9ZZZZ
MVRKPHANNANRRVSLSHRSPTRPVMSAAIANANGTVIPTYPRYKIGGWNNTRMWFCSSGLGPGPLVTPSAPRWNASAGPSVSTKKKMHTTNITTRAHATNGSAKRLRKRCAMTTVYPTSTTSHNKMLPSSALQMAVMLNKNGVSADPTCCTYFNDQSR